MLNILCNLLNTIQKWKAERLCGYRVIVNVSAVFPWDLRADCKLQFTVTTQNHEFKLHITDWKKIKIQNLKYRFYWMHTNFTPSKILNGYVVSWGHTKCGEKRGGMHRKESDTSLSIVLTFGSMLLSYIFK